MRIIISYILLLVASSIFAQEIIVTGNITDINNVPLEEVLIKSSQAYYTVETHSDKNGAFQLAIPDTASVITISKAGYKDFKSHVYSNTNLLVKLEYSELVDMSIEEILRTKINTVSLKEEDISNAPGIVSVITGEELRNLGIRTVREALTLIPGFIPFQNDDEQILAVRGVFATTSQKILFMRNGHSLNEGNLDIPQMEFSISIENIQKIEIIRGPGASIYGNSAFAAVVNIITKEEEGTRLKTAVGNYGYFDTDGYISRKIDENSSVILWGRYAKTAGEKSDVGFNAGNTLGQINGTYKTYSYPLNYDVGFKYKSEILSASIAARKHSYNTFWTADGVFTNTDILFWQPRLSQNSIHNDVTLHFDIDDDKTVVLQNYADYSTLNNFRLTSSISDSTPNGVIQANEWNVLKSGMNYYASWYYSNLGSFSTGLAYEYRKYLDSWITSNKTDPATLDLPQEYYPRMDESRFAAYFQANHTFSSWFKLDVGGRFDFAQEFKATFNPRLALIFRPVNNTTLKLIYTKAFQAPGYSYRNANNSADFSGSIEELQPERINTYQSSVRYNLGNGSFIELSGYYNRLENMIARHPIYKYYTNFGKLATYGAELDAHFIINKQVIFARYAMLLPDTTYMDSEFKIIQIKENRFKNMPQHSINSGVIFNIYKKLHVSLYSQFTSTYFDKDNIRNKSKILLNSNLQYSVSKNINFGCAIYNITNEKYLLGDPSIRPLPQPGRWFTISLEFSF